MQHHLDRLLRRVLLKPLTPIIAHCIREYSALPIEVRRCDWCAYTWIALETVLCVAVPEVECAVATGGGECAVLGVE